MDFKQYYILFLLPLIIACKKEYAPLEYKTWIESGESGLNKHKNIGELEYAIQYQTKEYLLLINKGPKGIENCDIETELENYTDDHQILFTITNEKGIAPLRYHLHDEQEYYARIEYMNGEVMKDCYLLSEGDTLNCLFAHMERDFGISPELRINFSFEKGEPNKDLQFCFNDRIFNNGMIKLSLLAENINDLPDLRKK